jgi:hypothetical protein
LDTPQLLTVNAEEIRGSILRRPDGSLDFQDFFPPPDPEEAPTPFAMQFNAKDVVIRYEDQTTFPPAEATVIVPEVEVSIFESTYDILGDVEVVGIGELSMKAVYDDPSGFFAQGTVNRLDLAEFRRRLGDIKEIRELEAIRDIRADELEVTGPFTIDIPKQGPFYMNAQLEATGRNIAWQEYYAQTAFARGRLTQDGFTGEIDLGADGTRANFSGALAWDQQFRLSGSLNANATGSEGLPRYAGEFVPPGISAGATRFTGRIVFRQDRPLVLEGTVASDRVAAQGETATALSGDLRLQEDRLRFVLASGTWRTVPLSGAIEVGIASGVIAGKIEAPSVPFEQIARDYGFEGVSGNVALSILLSGTTQNPTAIARTAGSVAYRIAETGQVIAGAVQAEADYTDGTLVVSNLLFNSPLGNAFFKGNWDTRTGEIGGDFIAQDFDVSQIDPRVGGLGYAVGSISGTINDPLARVSAQAYNLEFEGQSLPLANLLVTIDREQLTVDSLEAARGAGSIEGSGRLVFEGQVIEGVLSARNILVSEFAGEEAFGFVEVEQVLVSGTLSDPVAAGVFSSAALGYQGRTLTDMKGNFRYAGNRVAVEEVTARMDEGRISGSGSFDIETLQAEGSAEFTDLPVANLAPEVSSEVALEGRVSGNLQARTFSDGSWTLDLDGQSAGVSADSLLLGGGPFSVRRRDGVWNADASVGLVDRYIALEEASFIEETQEINAKLYVYQFSLAESVLAGRGRILDLPTDIQSALLTLSGKVDARVEATGTLSEPVVDVAALEASELSVYGRDVGRIEGSGVWSPEDWLLRYVQWRSPYGQLDAVERTNAQGERVIDGDLNNFDLEFLTVFNPDLDRFQGQVSIPFLVENVRESPVLTASVASTPIRIDGGVPGTADDTVINVDFPLVRVQDGQIDAVGSFDYQGIIANMTAMLPFTYKEGPDNSRDMDVQVVVPRRNINEFLANVGGFDLRRTSGTLGGNASITGTFDNPLPKAEITADMQRLVFEGTEIEFAQSEASFVLNELFARAQFNGVSPLGGNASAQAEFSAVDLVPTLMDDPDRFFSRALKGYMEMNAFKVRDEQMGGSFAGQIDGRIDLSGTVRQPDLKGHFDLDGVAVTLPEFEAGTGEQVVFPINPTFDVTARLVQPVRINFWSGFVEVIGDARFNGSLNRPVVRGDFVTTNGQVRLPTSTLTVEDGGTIRLDYATTFTGEPDARLDVNLLATTYLIDNPFGDQVNRYYVELFLRGNVLQEDGLVLRAESDPPDLSQQRILFLLGEGELITAITGQDISGRPTSLPAAVVGATLPYLFDPITMEIGRAIGLDFLQFDWNALTGVSVTAAKSLGRGFFIQARRQISQPTFGRQRFDVLLFWRAPARTGFLNRFTVGVGTDQDRPWKIQISYSTRF